MKKKVTMVLLILGFITCAPVFNANACVDCDWHYYLCGNEDFCATIFRWKAVSVSTGDYQCCIGGYTTCDDTEENETVCQIVNDCVLGVPIGLTYKHNCISE